MYIHMGPQLIVSSEGLLWGRESAQGFDYGEISHSRHAKAGMKWSPIHEMTTLDHA